MVYGMIGVFKVAMATVAALVAGDEVVVMVKAEPVGIGFERQLYVKIAFVFLIRP